MFLSTILALILMLPQSVMAAGGSLSISGVDLFNSSDLQIKTGAKGIVIVFLSAKCPCSNSHIEAIKNLAKEFSEFKFVAVHSNADEPTEMARTYFKAQDLKMQVIEDKNLALANQYKALKTPHAFLLAPDGRILYKGGVSNSNINASADRHFLREALSDVQAGRAVATAEGRTLGCMISRGEKFVW